MRIFTLLFFLVLSSFALEINSAYVLKNGIKFDINGANSSDIGKIYGSYFLDCTPKLKGAYHLESEQVLSFSSSSNIPTSTNFSCNLGGKNFNFSSAKFGANSFEKIGEDKFFIAFNDSVKNLENFVKLSDKSLKSSVSRVDDSSFIIEIQNPNRVKFDILIDKNLENSNGKKLEEELFISGIKSGSNREIYLDSQDLQIDQNLTQSISQNAKLLGFRIYLDYYMNITNPLIKSEGVKNFIIKESRYDYEKDKFYIDILSYDFKPNKEYKITLERGFGDFNEHDEYGYNKVLKEDINFNLKMPNYKKEVKFIDDKPYISNKGAVFITSTNVAKIQAEISKVSDENIRYFLNFDSKDESFSEPKRKELDVDFAPNVDINSSINFDKLEDGIYKLNIYYTSENDEINTISKYLYFSDIAVHSKVFNDSIFVFLNRISNNQTIDGAKITLFSDKNKILAIGKTQRDGSFNFYKKDFLKERPKSLLVEYDRERNFLIFNEKSGEFENLYKNQGKKPSSFIYLTSDIIYPKEPLEGTIILKDGFKSLEELPIKIEIYDPNSNKIYAKTAKLDRFGAFDLDIKEGFEISGKYNLWVIFEDNLLATKDFSVESFVPQSLKVFADFSKEIYSQNESLKLNLDATYLFGQKASNLSSNLNLLINQSSFKDTKFSDYTFDDESLYDHNIFSYNANILLDQNTTLIVNPTYKTKLNSKLEAKTNFMVNDGGKSSWAYATSYIYPFESIVGIKQNGKKFSFISIDPITLKSLNSKLQATLYKEEWSYNLNENGVLSWFPSYKFVSEFEIKDSVLDLSALEDSYYKLVVKDLKSTHESAVNFGFGSALRPTNSTAIANIELNQATYKKGDEIVANISSPLKNALFLMTLEDDKVISHQIINVDNYSASVKFDIKDDFNTLYLSVKALRIADTPSTLLPFKAENSIHIKRDNSDKKLALTLIAPQISKSNSDFSVNVKTSPNSKVYLFAIDHGILNITDQKSPKAFEFFDKIYAKKFANFDIYNELTHFKSNAKIINFGSDMALMRASMQKYLDPVAKFEAYMLMKTAISDESGNANFTLNSPINSKIRLDVIALNQDQISQESRDIVIKDDILVKMPSLLYLLKGDKIELPIRIFNNTSEEKNLNFAVSTSQNLAPDISYLNATLKPNTNKTLNLKISAKDMGEAWIKIEDKTLNLSILPSSSLNTKVVSQMIKADTKIGLNDTYKEAKISVSSLPTALFAKDFDALISYPHGCSEQISSKLLAMHYSKPKTQAKIAQKERFIKEGIKILENRQKSSGDFGYWSGDGYVNSYASIFATDTLLTLKKAGYSINPLVIEKSLNALSNRGTDSDLADIYAAYLLSKFSKLPSHKINRIYDQKLYPNSLITHYMMAIILKNSGLRTELSRVENEIKNYKFQTANRDFYNFGSDIRNLSFALFLHQELYNETNEVLLNKIIELQNDTASTQDRAFVLRALNSMNSSDKFSLKITNGKNTYLIDENKNFDLNLTENSLNIELTSGNPYLSLISYGYEELPLKNSYENSAIDIKREFLDLNAEPVNLDKIKLNDIIFAKITLKFAKNFSDILVYQKAPSCLEIVNERVVQNIRNSAQTDSANFSHTQITNTSITNFLEPVYSGEEVVFYTPFRAILKGECALPEARSESMYNDKINNYSLEKREIFIK